MQLLKKANRPQTYDGRPQPQPRTRPELVSLVALLVATAALFMIGLDASGYANEFYAAAAQAGSTNWWSFLWGSSDAGNSIMVDKPPAALWPMALCVRVFGLSSWSILMPQAIMGVLSVWLLYATVRRAYGHWAGILAGAVLATTPIACLMFRFDNPDALLMLLLIACAHCVLRACELPDNPSANRSRTRWMALAGIAMGFAFLTKQLQAFLILPGIGVAFLLASPTSWRRKLLDTFAAFGALIVSAGWWVLLTVLVPASARPYIGGSQTNSFLELTFSYNGLGRITGSMEGAVLPGGSGTTSTIAQGHAGMWGQTGITRLFDGVWGTQWSWLAWVALAGIAIAFACTRKENRQSPRRSQAIVWGSWLLVTGVVFSFMGGTIHQYYTVALAPAVGALVAICVTHLWEQRAERWTQVTGLALVCVTAIWSIILLRRSDWIWVLQPLVAILAAGSVIVGVIAWRRARADQADELDSGTTTTKSGQDNLSTQKQSASAQIKALEITALGLALTSALTGPVSYSLYTAATGHTGCIVTAGPAVEGGSGMGGMGAGPGNGSLPGKGDNKDGMMSDNGQTPNGQTPNDRSQDGQSEDGKTSDEQSQGGHPQGSMPTPPDGNGSSAPDGSDGNTLGGHGPDSSTDGSGMIGGPNGDPSSSAGSTSNGSANTTPDGAAGPMPNSSEGGKGGAGGLLGGGSVSDELVAALKDGASSYRWVAATVGSQNAAGYQLATECSVMPIGGFNGSDPSPTLEQFQEWVAQGQIHYFISGGGVGGGTQIGGSDTSSQISEWVQENYEATTIGGVTVYDLSE